MNKNVWKVTFEERWSYMLNHVDEEDFTDTDSETYTVAASSYSEALEKARAVALSGNFEDDEDETIIHKCVDVRLVKIECGEELDG